MWREWGRERVERVGEMEEVEKVWVDLEEGEGGGNGGGGGRGGGSVKREGSGTRREEEAEGCGARRWRKEGITLALFMTSS